MKPDTYCSLWIQHDENHFLCFSVHIYWLSSAAVAATNRYEEDDDEEEEEEEEERDYVNVEPVKIKRKCAEQAGVSDEESDDHNYVNIEDEFESTDEENDYVNVTDGSWTNWTSLQESRFTIITGPAHLYSLI